MSIQSKVESLLFVTIRPLAIKQIMEKVEAKKEEVEAVIEQLMLKYNSENSGVNLQKIDDKVQFVTSSDNSKMISEYLKEEVSGELTPASLETLTVVAYRGPISKTELELIRGVNCSLILRNLLIRGLVEEKKDKNDLSPKYQITFDFLRHLGLNEAKELPDYQHLNTEENLLNLLKDQIKEGATSAEGGSASGGEDNQVIS